jgi:hypothetical protein
MPTIQPLSSTERDFLNAFGITAVWVSRTGKVFTSENPRHASQVFWCKHADAERVADLAQRNGDIVGAAARLSVQLTEHAKLIARVRERTGWIEAALREAKADGLLAQFHQEYKQRRLKAKARGETFMGFAEAERRLRAVIADAVAKGDGTVPSFVAVFDEARPISTPTNDR